jgi:hypothetical protein
MEVGQNFQMFTKWNITSILLVTLNFASSTIWPLKNPFNSKQMIQIWAMQFGKIKSLVTFVASMSISRFSSIS